MVLINSEVRGNTGLKLFRKQNNGYYAEDYYINYLKEEDFMTEYLGISMVVIVIGLVIAITGKLLVGGVLDEIERIKQKRFEKRVKTVAEAIIASSKYVESYMKNVKEAIDMDKELNKEYAAEKAAEAFEKTIEETPDLKVVKDLFK